MSASPRCCSPFGYTVSGSDLVDSEDDRRLGRLGARIYLGAHDATHVTPGIDVLVISSAVTFANPEVASRAGAQIPIIPRPRCWPS